MGVKVRQDDIFLQLRARPMYAPAGGPSMLRDPSWLAGAARLWTAGATQQVNMELGAPLMALVPSNQPS